MINATFLKIIMSIVLVLAYLLLVFNQYINRKKNKDFCKNIAKQTCLFFSGCHSACYMGFARTI